MQNKQIFVGLPFYIFITLTLGIIAVISLQSIWNPGAPIQTVLFTVVFAVFIGQFWLNLRFYAPGGRLQVFYYFSQALLILGLFWIRRGTGAAGTVIGTAVISIIGETLGLWGNTRRALYLGLFFAVLGLVLLYFLVDQGQFGLVLFNMLVNGGFIVVLMVVLNQQLAERQKAMELAETLESTNAKLAAYAAKIENLTLQNERQRMARELHDTLAQGLAGLVLQLEAVKMHLAAGRTERSGAVVEQALARARSTLAESRAAIDDLRAAPVNLAEAVREKVDRFIQTTGIPCQLELELAGRQLPADTAGHALRVLDEALANAARHARASQVIAKFTLRNNDLELEVSDNGQGFNLEQERIPGHYGLSGMQERAALTGGELTIESDPKNGTILRFKVPGAGNGGTL